VFDVFDIQVPALAASSPIEVRQRKTAFGVTEQRMAYVGGVEFGRIVRADEAYVDLQAWTGATDRGGWTVLIAAPAAREAAGDDERWSSFLGALVSVLQAHQSWVVRCESDCDQHPLERLEISAERLSEILGARRGENAPVAIVAVPP
jgi:hypothetical protein